MRQLTAGIYVYLPLGQRAIDKVNAIIREEMNGIGGQEITMPVLHPAELWQQSGRWHDIKDEMFRLKDRHGRDMCLGMTHEEVVAWLAAKEIRSYRELPQVWYQIQTKERDEARPRSGVLRTREFWMKDAYTLDADDAGLDVAYERQKEAYNRIFRRAGLAFHVVESDVGMMGGAGAHEFMAPSAAGEDEIARCPACGYAANVELARSRSSAPTFSDGPRGEVATPGVRTIAEVCQLLGIEPAHTIKSLLYVGPSGPVLALVRGDQQLHEKKLARLLGGEVRAAHADEVRDALGAPVGSVGPVGAAVPIVADEALGEGVYVAGANREGVHLRGVRPGRDFAARHADLHLAQAGDACPDVRGAARRRARHRGREHLQARDEVLGEARRDVPRRAGAGAADRHGVVRDRPGPDRRVGDRAASRRGRHRVALVDRARAGPRSCRSTRSSRRCARWRSGSTGSWARRGSRRSWTTATSGPG